MALKQGGIYAHGTPQEVMTEEVVREVFGLDSRIIADPVAGTPMCIPLSRKVRSAIA